MFDQYPPLIASHDVPKTYRKPYKKSTSGCTECKRRKIKCDEVQPTCSNCQRRFVDNAASCKYMYTVTCRRSGACKSSIRSNPILSPLQNSPSVRPFGSSHTNLIELRLMHHYTQMTRLSDSRRSLSIEPTLPNSAWEIDIPQIAFSSNIVLNALFAVSALNLMSLNPGDKTCAFAAKFYFDRAVVKQQAAVNNMGFQNLESLFVASILLVHYNWLSYHINESREPYEIDLTTYYMCEGSKALIQTDPAWITKYHYASIVDKTFDQKKESHDTRFMEQALFDMEILLNSLKDSVMTQKSRDVYESVADDVIATYRMLAGERNDDSVLEQRIVTILHRVPAPFIQLLEKKEPIAVALLARNLVLLSVFDTSPAWWIHGAGEHMVTSKAIYGLYSLISPAYIWVMDWPLRILSKKITVSRGGRQVNASQNQSL